MYQPTTDTTDLIVRFINAPHDPKLQDQIAMLKSTGPEQAAYVERMLHDWLKQDAAPNAATMSMRRYIPICKWVLPALVILVTGFVLYHLFCREKLIINNNHTGYIDSFLLADGSKAILNNNAEIAYPSIFNGENRRVYMHKGEAFFNVKESALPFQLQIGKIILTTNGGSFNVRIDENKTAVFVTDGKVKMKGGESEELLLTPGLQGSREGSNELQQDIRLSDGALAWKTGRLRFVNVPLSEVLDAVRNYYDIQIDVPPSAQSALKKSLTANFDAEGPEKVLDVISKKIGVFITKDKEGRYYLTLK
ncbi:FecR family protein [Chitinophaga sp. Cy-1792]|uniref:FecR family protein n=1 Tax=Chitinophaga sp. Cy-1792 TaxID=2608339 RepID=UPI00141FFFE6|nr:FecR domain-containing protein [Chitinophaga sp. Cy-1792]